MAVVDNDKANIINCTEKKWVRTIRLWSGPMTRDMKYGLGAPNKGGLYLVDLTTGNNLATFIQPGQEGVFTRLTGRGGKDSSPHPTYHAVLGFTQSEDYVWYYHSGRGTIRLFRRHDATMIANYALATEATTILSTSWALLAGDKDGAVTMLAIVDPRYNTSHGIKKSKPSPKSLVQVQS